MQDIQVIRVDQETGRVSFHIGWKPLTGSALLNQIVVLSLLNVPGKDILDPSLGGGIPELIGSSIDASDATEVLGEINRRVKKSQSEIVQAQIGLDLLPEERLRELSIVKAEQGSSLDEILVTIRVVNEAGRVTDLVL